MIDTATIERYMRDANPIPHIDDLNPDEFGRFVAAADARRAVIMQAPTQHETTPSPPTAPPPLRRRNAWVFAAAFIFILASIGIAALVLRSDEAPVTDEPAPPTTIAETPEQPISAESLTWTRVPLDQAVFSGEVSDIVVGGPGLVAVGGEGPGGGLDVATVWTSPDGYAWSRVPHDEAIFGTDLKIKGVTVGGPGLVAVGDVDVWTSVDGYTWSRVARNPAVFHPITGDLRGVIAGGPGLVAFGESDDNTAGVWTSPDGYTWTQVHHDETVGIIGITRGGPGFVAVGGGETCAAVWTSPDGHTWTRVPHDPSVFSEGTGMADVAAGASGLVAVGFEKRDGWPVAAVWTSPDGFSWTRIPHDEAIFGSTYEDMSSVAAVGDGFVAVGGWGGLRVWTSPDGSTWNRMLNAEAVFGETTSLHTVIAGGPGVVALGGMEGDRTAIWVATPTEADEPATATTTD